MQATSSKIKATRYTSSSSFKMAALFTVLLSVCGLILGWLLYDFGQQNFIRETEAAIDSKVASIRSEMRGASQEEITSFIATKAASQPHPYYLYLGPNSERLAGNLSKLPEQVHLIAEGLIGFDYQGQHLAAKIHTFDGGSRLMVARNIDDIIASHERLEWLSILMFLLMLTVITVSFLISYFVVSRINRIGSIAGTIIETGDLSQRVPIDSNWDDLSSLGEALNLLLSKVESLMCDIRDVADNIAHDLRTPLMRLRTQLEGLKADKKKSAQEVESLLAEADGLLATFNALLRISNIEKAKRHQQFEKVDLRVLLHDVVELYEPLAEERQVAIHPRLAKEAIIHADRDMIFQLFANLLDNAIKFSPEASEVKVALHKKGEAARVVIADHGIGIEKENRNKVFDRFYRTDKSRHTKGSGLGLSLVKAVADLHKADIVLKDNKPGLHVTVSF